jgi:hypothetical protein
LAHRGSSIAWQANLRRIWVQSRHRALLALRSALRPLWSLHSGFTSLEYRRWSTSAIAARMSAGGGWLRLFNMDLHIGTVADAGTVRHVEITLDDPSETHAQQPGSRQPF